MLLLTQPSDLNTRQRVLVCAVNQQGWAGDAMKQSQHRTMMPIDNEVRGAENNWLFDSMLTNIVVQPEHVVAGLPRRAHLRYRQFSNRL